MDKQEQVLETIWAAILRQQANGVKLDAGFFNIGWDAALSRWALEDSQFPCCCAVSMLLLDKGTSVLHIPTEAAAAELGISVDELWQVIFGFDYYFKYRNEPTPRKLLLEPYRAVGCEIAKRAKQLEAGEKKP